MRSSSVSYPISGMRSEQDERLVIYDISFGETVKTCLFYDLSNGSIQIELGFIADASNQKQGCFSGS